jgi:hypothetical protein
VGWQDKDCKRNNNPKFVNRTTYFDKSNNPFLNNPLKTEKQQRDFLMKNLGLS